jgi:predicted transcriptional regulator
MKNLEIEQLEEKDELNADALISLGIGSKAAFKQVKMRNMKSTESTNCKRSTRLLHMEVSITIKQSLESDWISASESLLE